MIEIARAWHHSGKPFLPPQLQGDGPFLISWSQIEEWTKKYSIMLYRNYDFNDAGLILAFDEIYKRFQQR